MKSKLKKINIRLNHSSPELFSGNDPCFTFLVFHNPASVEVNDSFFDATASSVLIRKPEISLNVNSSGNYPLSYSYLSFSGQDAVKIFSLSNAEANILLKPLQVHFTDSIFTKIETELSHKGVNWESVVSAYILELLSKTYRLSNHDFVETLPDHAQNLRDLRSEIHENYFKPWKIDEMAEKMNLSTSRFASLYKSTFKISPTEDLIQTRIDQAKKMLSSSKVSVKKVSEACGFESVHYFHRAFKKRANSTPKHFQNRQFAQEGSVYTPERHFSLDRLTQLAEYSGIIEMINGELKFHGNTEHVSELLGYDQAYLRDRPFMDFVAPEDVQLAQDGAKNILKNKNILDLNIRLLAKSGDKVSVQFSALLKGKNWYWFMKHAAVAAI
jgi:AraC-like DNA-binding protein